MTEESAANTMQLGQAPMDRRLVFMTVGAMGLGLQLLMLRLLATGTTLALQTSMVLAVETALLHNFVWHERWTWADRKPSASSAWLQRLARFHLTSGVLSIAGNVALTSLFVTVAGLHYLVANVLAVGRLHPPQLPGRGSSGVSLAGAQMTRARRRRWIGVFAACLALTAPAAEAAPQADTVAAWHVDIQATEQRIARELASPDGFLVQHFSPSPDSAPGALKRGDIGVVRMASLDRAGGLLAVPNGMVHHWRGSVFIPGTTLDGCWRGFRIRPQGTWRRRMCSTRACSSAVPACCACSCGCSDRRS